MELFPTLKIGVLNGWMLLAILYLTFGVLLLIFPKNVVKELYKYDRSRLSKKQKAFNIIRESLGLVSLVLIVFTPLKTRSILFIPGIILFGLGLAGFVVALFNFKNRPVNQPVVQGLYRISRHPQILMLFISVCGISIAIGSWLVLFLQFLASIFGHSRIMLEEQACLEQFGDEYCAYMKRVPRYILFF
jgi:protein-S-isoprenylcysteine O-methyltransferase Ste14